MKVKSLIAGSVLAASAVASSVAMAESPWSANIGVTSNYMWRGITQTNNAAAIQGGIDYAHDSGFYAGAWTSNVNFGDLDSSGEYELDLYAGYGFDLGETSWDIGYIAYLYPKTDSGSDFGEVYLNFGWEWLSAGVAYMADNDFDPAWKDGDLYYYAGADFEVGGVGLGALIAKFDFKSENETLAGEELDYTHWDVHVSKSDFTLTVGNTDIDDDDVTVWVAWGKTFDF